jgi:type I restriction enzyme S subunit
MKNGMKQTEIGEIPVEWGVVQIGEIADVKGGKRLPKGHTLIKDVTPYPYIRVSDMFMGGVDTSGILYVPINIHHLIARYTISKNDLFISVAGTLGLVGEIPEILDGANLTENADKLTNIKCDKKFLLYVLKSPAIQDAIAKEQTNNAQPKLALAKIREFVFALPSKYEQRKIAEILSTLDEKMAVMDEQLVQTQELKKGLMQRLLTKGIGHSQFKDSPLGEIPASWEVKFLEQLVDTKRNIRYGIVQTGENLANGIPCLRVADFNSRQFEVATMIKTSPEVSAGYSSTILKANDIVFPLRGRIGEVRLVDSSIEGINLTRGIALISTSSRVKAEYLLWQLRSPAVRKEILAKVNGTTLQEIPITGLKKVIVPVASESEQRQIAEILTTVDEKIGVLQDKKAQYQTLKRGLMQQLLTGQRRVRVQALETAALL